MTNKYVKKAIPVEAVQWNGDNVEEIRSLYTRRYRGSRKATGFRAPNNMIQKGTNLIVYGRANTIINTIRLSDYVVVENGFFKIVSKNRFETEYEQQDSNHTSKPSDFSLRNLVMQIAPKHIKYYIKRLEEYGFKLELINEALIGDKEVYLPFIFFRDKNCNDILIVNQKGCYSMSGYRQAFELRMAQKIIKKSADCTILKNDYIVFEVENNNWREAFNKLVASFPDSIMKNTNR